ncbi:DEAD/DEAH box helicase [Helicobacter sp. 16-1353]|uniref:DEAD/DEAH box helicase n=1 Tax=Helicobacter sp. 16-1353 TaxID=2004996 RepID=UPI000DCB942E|nr:DEAD/DEAH box helicase [Helicobacter sp. 16-1353]RAX52045.1 DEAD/DEAH box helicase [Helicobacter sp. 16-1353]
MKNNDTNGFLEFHLKEKVLKGIFELGFTTPSPVQKDAIPFILEGHDLIAQAQTGTGKTAAFAIPLLNMLKNNNDIEALVVTPTRELAMQISDEIFKLGRFLRTKTICIYGGQSIKRQIELLNKKPQVMVATPGRLLDHLRNDRIKNFNPKIIVLDESDEMLDMGFLESIEDIFRFIPKERQTLLFSATMPTPIKNLANKILNNPKNVKITAANVTNTDIEQKYYIINENERDSAIMRLIDATSPQKSIIFTRMKKEADKLATFLISKGYKATPLHGDMEQRERQSAIRAFKENRVEILVATDVASRGLDITDVSHVFNYHMPLNPESYVHRIGRTGRAGKKGVAITLVTPLEFRDLKRIKDQIKTSLELFELSDTQTKDDFVSKILEYKISSNSLDLYPILSSKIDNTQLVCKLLSYLSDILAKDSGVSQSEIKRLQNSLDSTLDSKSVASKNTRNDSRKDTNKRANQSGDRNTRRNNRVDKSKNNRANRDNSSKRFKSDKNH